MIRPLLASALIATATTSIGSSLPLVSVDFEGTPIGEISDRALKDHWQAKWASTGGRAAIVVDDDPALGKVLRVRYPKGTVGPRENGGQFEVALPPANEYWLSFRVKFEKGFDFRRGGKLPGLTSGGEKYTGGNHPTEGQGWSARYMWQGGGEAIVYFYSVDMPGKWGEGLKLPGVQFIPGRWHTLTQHIKINAPDATDGILEVWFDGVKVYGDKAERFRIGDQGRIDSFYFSTFHGGNTPDWGPKNDSAARFDDFIVTTDRPVGLSD